MPGRACEAMGRSVSATGRLRLFFAIHLALATLPACARDPSPDSGGSGARRMENGCKPLWNCGLGIFGESVTEARDATNVSGRPDGLRRPFRAIDV